MSTDLSTRVDERPSFLIADAQKGEATGMEGASAFLTPPRLKIMQANRKGDFKDFPEACAIVTPTNEIACEPQGFFAFTVLFRYQEFCVHNPYKRPEGLPYIRESTRDFNSEIAQKCRNFVTEPFPQPGDWKPIVYATHYNFVIAIHGVPALLNKPVLWSCYIGSGKAGRHTLDLLASRTSDDSKIYGHILMAQIVMDKKGQDEWWTYRVSNPTADVDVGKYVTDEAQYRLYAKTHEQCAKDYLQYKPEDEDDVEVTEEVTSDTL